MLKASTPTGGRSHLARVWRRMEQMYPSTARRCFNLLSKYICVEIKEKPLDG